MSSETKQIEFYFDPISPYAWLASTRLAELEQASGMEIIAKPILFAGLLKAHGNIGPAEIAAKRHYTFRDVLRRAQSLGLSIESVPNHPFNPLLSLRVCTAIKDNAKRKQLGVALMNTGWGGGKDITQASTSSDVLVQCEIDADWAIAAASEPSIKQALIDNTAAAVESGIFGVPTFKIGNEIFWGEDRIVELMNYLDGQRIDEAKLSDILAREAGVHRKR